MITEALLTTVKNWKQNKRSSLKKPGKQRYTACQMNELDPYVPTNINFKIVMFNGKKMPNIYFYVSQKL